MYNEEERINKVYEFKLNEIEMKAKAPPNFSQKKKSKLKTFLTFEIPVLHQMTGVNAYISQMGFVTAQFNF